MLVLDRKTRFLLVGFAAASFFVCGLAQAATLESVKGDVKVLRAGATDDNWQAVTEGVTISNGDEVKAGAGTCTLVYSNMARIEIVENTNFVLQDRTSTHDILLKLGKLRAEVNHQNADMPFQLVSATAVASVRGTKLDFEIDGNGQLQIDMHDGNVQAINPDIALNMPLKGGQSVTIFWDKVNNILTITNGAECSGTVAFSVFGSNYTAQCGQTVTIDLSTAQGPEVEDIPDDEGGTNEFNETVPDELGDDDPPAPSSSTGGEQL